MNRPRLKALRKRAAAWLRLAAGRVYREPLHTIEITVGDPPQTVTYCDCREAYRDVGLRIVKKGPIISDWYRS